MKINIDNKVIGNNYPPYIIAEISANHNGDLDRAKNTITAAKKSGADAVKLQTYTADSMTLNSSKSDFIIKRGLWKGYKLYDLYKKGSTPYRWHKDLFNHSRKIGITCFSTPFDINAVNFLNKFNVSAYKIASFEINDLDLIKHVCLKGKPVIISTGMANYKEIKRAVETASQTGNNKIVLLHCISGYPTPISECNLNTILDLKEKFNIIVGLSDHTRGSIASTIAIGLGARVIEKHFKIDNDETGLDSKFSLNPSEFLNLTNRCKEAWSALGKVDYELKKSEKVSVKFKRSIYFVKNLKKNTKIKKTDIKKIRPGFGLSPHKFNFVVGKYVNCNIKIGTPVKLKYLYEK